VGFARLCSGTVTSGCPHDVVYVSIGGGSQLSPDEIGVSGAGRHRLLSVIASVLTESVGFVFLKTPHSRIKHSRVLTMISRLDLISSYAFIAFRRRQFGHAEGQFNSSDTSFTLPEASFGSIHDGILLSRAACEIMLSVANDEAELQQRESVPAACSEFLVFSDAWLCWCAASLGIPAINIHFAVDAARDVSDRGSCAAPGSLYSKLVQLYEQQRLSESSPLLPPFTEITTLGFRYYMHTLLFHLAAGPHILNIPDDEDRGELLFWDACCGQLLVDHMQLTGSRSVNAGVHPLLQRLWGALAGAPNRNAFVDTLRTAVVASNIQGRDAVNSSMHAVRRRIRMSVSAARVLGCSVVQSSTMHQPGGDDMLHGSLGSSGTEPLQMHIITPAVMLSSLDKPVSRQLYLATHSHWTRVFGYNPLFTKEAALAFAAPEFGVHDWNLVCMLAVSSMKRSGAPSFDVNSREYFACSAFASAVWQRTYAKGMPKCFDMPLRAAGDARHATFLTQAEYLERCQKDEDGDDPWMLRQLAESVQALLLHRWDVQQVCNASIPAPYARPLCKFLIRHFAPRAGSMRLCICTAC
jgi:hypothetical protein